MTPEQFKQWQATLPQLTAQVQANAARAQVDMQKAQRARVLKVFGSAAVVGFLVGGPVGLLVAPVATGIAWWTGAHFVGFSK